MHRLLYDQVSPCMLILHCQSSMPSRTHSRLTITLILDQLVGDTHQRTPTPACFSHPMISMATCASAPLGTMFLAWRTTCGEMLLSWILFKGMIVTRFLRVPKAGAGHVWPPRAPIYWPRSRTNGRHETLWCRVHAASNTQNLKPTYVHLKSMIHKEA